MTEGDYPVLKALHDDTAMPRTILHPPTSTIAIAKAELQARIDMLTDQLRRLTAEEDRQTALAAAEWRVPGNA